MWRASTRSLSVHSYSTVRPRALFLNDRSKLAPSSRWSLKRRHIPACLVAPVSFTSTTVGPETDACCLYFCKDDYACCNEASCSYWRLSLLRTKVSSPLLFCCDFHINSTRLHVPPFPRPLGHLRRLGLTWRWSPLLYMVPFSVWQRAPLVDCLSMETYLKHSLSWCGLCRQYIFDFC